MYISQDRFIDDQKKIINTYIGMNANADLINKFIGLETFGGNCPQCGKPWIKVIVKNECASFVYYNPLCNCYSSCPRCDTSWHREVGIMQVYVKEIRKCASCNWTLKPVYGRKCFKCREFFTTDNSDWNQRCDNCERKGKKKKEI